MPVMRFDERAAKLVGGAAVALLTALSGVAHAEAKVCIDAHAQGQREAMAGHLRAAARLFTACGAEPACPDSVRKECTERLESVRRSIPSVIFAAQDEGGNDLTTVKVYADDDLVADGLDGRPIEMDPGSYRLLFEFPGGAMVTSDVLIREAEKDRIIEAKQPPKKAVPAAHPGGAPSPAPSTGALRAAPWVVAGLGVAALGTGTALGLMGRDKKSQIDRCRPDCPASQQSVYDSAKALYLGADIAFGGAVVAAAVATWLFVVSSGSTDRPPVQAAIHPVVPVVRLGVSLTPGGGGIGAVGAF